MCGGFGLLWNRPVGGQLSLSNGWPANGGSETASQGNLVMKYHPIFDRTGLSLSGIVLAGCVLIALLLSSPASAGEQANPQQGKTTTEKSNDYVETAKPTEDGTVHPNGVEPKPREQWLSPCPADKKITKTGECIGMDEAAAGENAQK